MPASLIRSRALITEALDRHRWNEIPLPGFVNGHHHVGLTPVQLGSPDMPLELWFVTRMVARNLNLYLDTLYSVFEMIASGVTTVQHIHGWTPGKLAAAPRQPLSPGPARDLPKTLYSTKESAEPYLVGAEDETAA